MVPIADRRVEGYPLSNDRERPVGWSYWSYDFRAATAAALMRRRIIFLGDIERPFGECARYEFNKLRGNHLSLHGKRPSIDHWC